MPYYEFVCSRCGVIREKFYRVIPKIVPNSVDITCNRCGAIRKHNKVMSTPNFHLKGTGWAKDGYSHQMVDGSRVMSVTEPE